jgi:outer membrane biosynthesis protein TonB
MEQRPLAHRGNDRRGRFGLGWAIGISIAFHLLLILFSTWIPVDSRPARVDLVEDNPLQFTFAPPVEQDQQGEKKGEVPLPPTASPPVDVPPPQPEEQPSLEMPPVLEQVIPQAEPLTAPVPVQEELPPPEEQTEQADQEQRGDLPDPIQDSSRDDQTSGEILAGLQEFQQRVDRYQAQRAEQEAVTGSIRNVFVPDMSKVPLSGSPYGILEFESRDYDFEDYSRQIYWAILYAWYKRLDATTPDFEKWAMENSSYFLEHQTRLRFVIESGGDVSGIQLELPAGCPPLDVSAQEAMAEVVLPPLPADFPRDREVVHVTFLIKGPVMSMRQMFQYYKSLGYF